MQQPPPDQNPTAVASASVTSTPEPRIATSKGLIRIKLIEARALKTSSILPRPYVIVQFEQNEFVGRDSIPESDKEVLDAKGDNGNDSLSPDPVWKHEASFDVTSEDSLITFNVYDRSHSDEGFLGTMQIKPILIPDHTVDQWYKLLPFKDEVVNGEIHIQITYEHYMTKLVLTLHDFDVLKLVGRGTLGKVFQVRKKDTKRIYAMKVLSKKEINANKEVTHTIGERNTLHGSLSSPFIVGLKFSFQTETRQYLLTDFKSGGELFWLLQRETRFSEERARFYIAELILALEHLHKYNHGHLNLKPENILLDATGHIALSDFGLSKTGLRSEELTPSFSSATEYLAPEVLLDMDGYSNVADFWSLGVLLFEMCCGWSPFYAENRQQMYRNICFGKIRFPKGAMSDEGKGFVKGVLNRNPKHRLGAERDTAELKEHPFFKSIDWVALSLKQVLPPFKPDIQDVVDNGEAEAEMDIGVNLNKDLEMEMEAEMLDGILNDLEADWDPHLVGGQYRRFANMMTESGPGPWSGPRSRGPWSGPRPGSGQTSGPRPGRIKLPTEVMFDNDFGDEDEEDESSALESGLFELE